MVIHDFHMKTEIIQNFTLLWLGMDFSFLDLLVKSNNKARLWVVK